VTQGQVEWYDDGPKGEFIGRLVQYNPTLGMASSFSCAAPCRCRLSYEDGFVTPDPIEGLPGDSFTLTAMEHSRDCHGNLVTRAATGFIFFTPSDPEVVTASGNVVTLLDAGETRVEADWAATTSQSTCTDPSEGCIERCENFSVSAFGSSSVTVPATA
jgi:hypothetical protein